jgi:MotA/TolQ/ExbB proton channel family
MAYPSVQALVRGHTSRFDPQPGAGNGPQPLVAAIMARLRSRHEDGLATPGADGAAAGSEAPERRAPLAFLSRCVVVQAIGAAGLIGLWIAGIANKPFEGDNSFLCWLIVGIAALGILCVFLQRWPDVEWLATHVVRIGSLGTVIGLIIAFSAAKAGSSTDLNEIKPMIAAVVDGMYVSLYATLLGIATNLWLKINLRLLGRIDG